MSAHILVRNSTSYHACCRCLPQLHCSYLCRPKLYKWDRISHQRQGRKRLYRGGRSYTGHQRLLMFANIHARLRTTEYVRMNEPDFLNLHRVSDDMSVQVMRKRAKHTLSGNTIRSCSNQVFSRVPFIRLSSAERLISDVASRSLIKAVSTSI
jgi:hypothetical protein